MSGSNVLFYPYFKILMTRNMIVQEIILGYVTAFFQYHELGWHCWKIELSISHSKMFIKALIGVDVNPIADLSWLMA